MNKIGTRISVGENYQAQQPLVQDLPQDVAQIQMAQRTEEQDGWDSLVQPNHLRITFLLFFLYKQRFVQHYPKTPSFLSLNKFLVDH